MRANWTNLPKRGARGAPTLRCTFGTLPAKTAPCASLRWHGAGPAGELPPLPGGLSWRRRSYLRLLDPPRSEPKTPADYFASDAAADGASRAFRHGLSKSVAPA